MSTHGCRRPVRTLGTLLLAAAAAGGCVHKQVIVPAPEPMPRELKKVTMPEYVIEPPDVLQIDALTVIPLPPYRIKPLDALAVTLGKGAIPEFPISDIFPVDPEGTIDFGPRYAGRVSVAGMTTDEARAAILAHLKRTLRDPDELTVTLAESRGTQQIRGQHLVRQDGTVGLGQYGSVMVTGLTLSQAKAAVEAHLRKYLKDPEVTLDVLAFNSKVFYVIQDGGGAGQQVTRLPIQGNETVLDAIGQVNGLTVVADRQRIWVSRPGPDGCETVLPVDWNSVTMKGGTGTNYQLMPGDRVFVQSYPLTRLDTAMARLFAPVERLFGVVLLGNSTVQAFRNGGQGGGFGGFGF